MRIDTITIGDVDIEFYVPTTKKDWKKLRKLAMNAQERNNGIPVYAACPVQVTPGFITTLEKYNMPNPEKPLEPIVTATLLSDLNYSFDPTPDPKTPKTP